MGLSKEEISRLLALPTQTRGGRKKSGWIDTSIRTHEVWFKLGHALFDADTQEMAKCDNPDCHDTRGTTAVVAVIKGRKMCRICFMEGWLLDEPEPDEETV